MNSHISALLEVLRYALSDNRSLVRSIDDIYERLLLEQLSLIPRDTAKTVVATCDILKCILTAIDFSKLSDSLSEYDGVVTVRVDFEKLAMNSIDKYFDESEKKTRAYLQGLVKNMKPLFNCMNKIIESPGVFSRKLSLYFENNDVAHIFD